MARLVLFHHKAATRWIRAVLTDASAATGASYRVFGGLDAGDLAAVRAGACRDYDVASIGNIDYEVIAGLPHEVRAFHVYRDPRDFVVSAYFSHLHSHPLFADLAEHRRRLASLPKEDGILLDIDWTERHVGYLGRIGLWSFEDPRIMNVPMETLTADPPGGFTRAFEFIGFEIARRRLDAILERNSFANLSGGRAPGSEKPDSHYRKGVPGDWKNHLTPRIERYLHEEFGNLVRRLGYAA